MLFTHDYKTPTLYKEIGKAHLTQALQCFPPTLQNVYTGKATYD